MTPEQYQLLVHPYENQIRELTLALFNANVTINTLAAEKAQREAPEAVPEPPGTGAES